MSIWRSSRPSRSGRTRTLAPRLCGCIGALAGFPVTADILVYSRDDVEYWRDSINYVLARALREGRVLYERP